MQILRLLVVCIGWYNFDTHTAAKGTKAESFSKTSLAQSSNWSSSCNSDIAQVDFAYPTSASFTRPAIPEPCATCSTFCQDGELKAKLVRWQGSKSRLVLLPLQADEQKACGVLPVLWNPLGNGSRHLGWRRTPNPKEEPKCPQTKAEQQIRGERFQRQREGQRQRSEPAERQGWLSRAAIWSAAHTLPLHANFAGAVDPMADNRHCISVPGSSESTSCPGLHRIARADICPEEGLCRLDDAAGHQGHRGKARVFRKPPDNEGAACGDNPVGPSAEGSERSPTTAPVLSHGLVGSFDRVNETLGRPIGGVQEASNGAAGGRTESCPRYFFCKVNDSAVEPELQWRQPERDGGSLPRRASGIHSRQRGGKPQSRPLRNVHQWLGLLQLLSKSTRMEKRRKERKELDQRKDEMPICKKHRDLGLLLHLSFGERRKPTAMAHLWRCCWGLLRWFYLVLRCSKQHCHPPESLAIQGFRRLHWPVPGHSECCATSIRCHCWFTTTSDSNRCIWQISTRYSNEGPINFPWNHEEEPANQHRFLCWATYIWGALPPCIPAVTLGIDFLGTWHDKPWCLHDPPSNLHECQLPLSAPCHWPLVAAGVLLVVLGSAPHLWCRADCLMSTCPKLWTPSNLRTTVLVDFGHQDPEVFLEEEEDLSFLLASFSPEEDALITLEMYGLLITHHSIRSATTSGDIASIKDTIRRSWSDITPQHGLMNAFLLKPQDLIGTGPYFDAPNGTVMTQQQLKRPTWETRKRAMSFLLMQGMRNGATPLATSNATCTSKDALPSCHFAIPFDKEQFWASSFMMIGLHRIRMSKRCLLGLQMRPLWLEAEGISKNFLWDGRLTVLRALLIPLFLMMPLDSPPFKSLNLVEAKVALSATLTQWLTMAVPPLPCSSRTQI